jgi:CHAT domain-containing protein
MNDETLAGLAKSLTADIETAFLRFRELFFEALERRRLADCQALLDVLCATPSPRLQRECLYHRAIVLSEQSQFDQAEAILRDLISADLLPDQRARVLLELGMQLEYQGQWTESEHYYQEALSAYEANQDDLGRAKAFNNLGILYRFRAEQGAEDAQNLLTKALACHQAALKIAQDANDLWKTERNWHGLGMTYALLNRFASALASFQSDLALCETLDDPCDRAITLSDMAALVYQPQGQWTEAMSALDEAISILRGCGDDLHLAEALTRRGTVLAEHEQLKTSLSSFDEALAITESIRARLTTPTSQAGYRSTVEFIYVAPLSLHLRHGDAVRAFSAAERARSRVLADLLTGQTAHAHTQLPLDVLGERVKLHQALDEAYAEEAPLDDQRRLEQALADLDRQIELLDPQYAALESVATLTAEEVCKRLPPNAALLSFAGDVNDHLWIMVVTPAGARVEAVNQTTVRWLRRYISKHLDGNWQGSLVPDPTSGRLSPPSSYPALYKTLIAPVWDSLHSVQTVYILPFGPLHYLPLGALIPDIDSPPPLLAQGRRVVYAPNATILLAYCHTVPHSPHHGLLAVAPADDRLRFTHGAAETAARLAGGTAITGRGATREAFLTQAGRYRMVCFLGHAFFDQRHPMLSRLELSDGSLNANEILRSLRLQADLVVLSACDTGRSHVLRGEEILGLSRAMLYAGTPSLLVTLWPVHEIPTRLLVEKLIQNLSMEKNAPASFDPAMTLASTQCWLRNLPYAEARELIAGWGGFSMSDADEHVTSLWHLAHPGEAPRAESRPFAHPFFWSPYVLIGDQRSDKAKLPPLNQVESQPGSSLPIDHRANR